MLQLIVRKQTTESNDAASRPRPRIESRVREMIEVSGNDVAESTSVHGNAAMLVALIAKFELIIKS